MVIDVQVSNVLGKKTWSDRPWYGHWGLLNFCGHWWVKEKKMKDKIRKKVTVIT